MHYGSEEEKCVGVHKIVTRNSAISWTISATLCYNDEVLACTMCLLLLRIQMRGAFSADLYPWGMNYSKNSCGDTRHVTFLERPYVLYTLYIYVTMTLPFLTYLLLMQDAKFDHFNSKSGWVLLWKIRVCLWL